MYQPLPLQFLEDDLYRNFSIPTLLQCGFFCGSGEYCVRIWIRRRSFYEDSFIFYPIQGGSGEIRTHGPLTRTPVFKTGAFDHSATLPFVLLVRSDATVPHEIWIFNAPVVE